MKNTLLIAVVFIFFNQSFTQYSWAASPANITTDIVWTDSGGTGFGAGYGGVDDISAAFNYARRQEELQLGFVTNTLPDLVMPSQTVWDGLSDDAKALYLINDERTARAGIEAGVLGLPLAGIEQNIDGLAEYYAQFLHDNDTTGHDADGSGGPFVRIDDDPEIGNAKNCHEFLPRSENLAYFATTGDNIPLPLERSIYGFIYDDASSGWGHREAVLLQDVALNSYSSFTNNNGSVGHEGFLGVHHISSADYAPFPTFPSNFGSVVVMEIFDPVSDAIALTRECNYIVTLESDNIFGVEENNHDVLKRGEMAMAVLLAKNISPPATASGTEYNDVPSNHPNAVWIEQFKAEMFSEGCAIGKFCPDDVVTKEQLAKVILKAKEGAAYAPMPATGIYNDVPTTDLNADWIEALSIAGYTSGCDTDRFCPKQTVTHDIFNNILNVAFP